MAKVPTASRGKAYPKSSTDGFMSRGSGQMSMAHGDVAPKSANRVIDGSFDAAAAWTIGTDWSIAASLATGVPIAVSAVSQAALWLIPANDYEVTVVITRADAGAVTVDFTGGTPVASAPLNSVGSFTFNMTADTGNDTVAITKDATFNGDIDSISVRELIK